MSRLVLIHPAEDIPLLSLYHSLSVENDIRHIVKMSNAVVAIYNKKSAALSVPHIFPSASYTNIHVSHLQNIPQDIVQNQGAICISNIPSSHASTHSIRAFLSSFGPIVAISFSHAPAASFSCIVEYDSVVDAQSALENIRDTPINGSQISASFCPPPSEEHLIPISISTVLANSPSVSHEDPPVSQPAVSQMAVSHPVVSHDLAAVSQNPPASSHASTLSNRPSTLPSATTSIPAATKDSSESDAAAHSRPPSPSRTSPLFQFASPSQDTSSINLNMNSLNISSDPSWLSSDSIDPPWQNKLTDFSWPTHSDRIWSNPSIQRRPTSSTPSHSHSLSLSNKNDINQIWQSFSLKTSPPSSPIPPRPLSAISRPTTPTSSCTSIPVSSRINHIPSVSSILASSLMHTPASTTSNIPAITMSSCSSPQTNIQSSSHQISRHPLPSPTPASDLLRIARSIMARVPSSYLYDINLEAIALGHDPRTTLMIRHIPNKYTQHMFIDLINESHYGCFDFVYLRMDFHNKCNVGYAFVNFVSTESVLRFIDRFAGHPWSRFRSEKRCGVSYATIQGYDALVEKFRNSSVMLENVDYRPKVFYTSGDMIGMEKFFPGPNHGGYRPKVDVLFSRTSAWKSSLDDVNTCHDMVASMSSVTLSQYPMSAASGPFAYRVPSTSMSQLGGMAGTRHLDLTSETRVPSTVSIVHGVSIPRFLSPQVGSASAYDHPGHVKSITPQPSMSMHGHAPQHGL